MHNVPNQPEFAPYLIFATTKNHILRQMNSHFDSIKRFAVNDASIVDMSSLHAFMVQESSNMHYTGTAVVPIYAFSATAATALPNSILPDPNKNKNQGQRGCHGGRGGWQPPPGGGPRPPPGGGAGGFVDFGGGRGRGGGYGNRSGPRGGRGAGRGGPSHRGGNQYGYQPYPYQHRGPVGAPSHALEQARSAPQTNCL
ncbi:hypothetical protein HDU98_007319 [Podochytrium sp. JEL0797]|nr:hypothetical protein HDU98_007319 [Podochytrium sp. JEL0797]